MVVITMYEIACFLPTTVNIKQSLSWRTLRHYAIEHMLYCCRRYCRRYTLCHAAMLMRHCCCHLLMPRFSLAFAFRRFDDFFLRFLSFFAFFL